MVAALGSLLVRFKSIGFANVIGKTAKFKTKFGSMAKSVKPQVEGLTKSFGKFGKIVTGVLFALIAASPRLQAEFEILTIRVQEFLRPFGDELAPAIRVVSDLIDTLTEAFDALPQPIQDAATFGVGFVVSLGLVAGAIVTLGLLINPFTLILGALALAAGALKLAFDTNFLGIQDLITGVVDTIVLTLGKIVSTVESLLTGDLEGFLTGLGDLFLGGITSIVDIILFIPRAFLDVINDLTGGLGADFVSGGSSVIEGFFRGIGETILNAGNILGFWAETVLTFLGNLVADFAAAGTAIMHGFFTAIGDAITAGIDAVATSLDDFFALFGGSLPEKGPLTHMVPAGEELGQAYAVAIGSGVESGASSVRRTLNIENLNLGFKEESLDTERSFFDDIDEGVRRSTSW
jgi:hypothetical protein